MGKSQPAPAPAPAPVPAPPPVTPVAPLPSSGATQAQTQTPTEVLQQQQEEQQAVVPAPPEPTTIGPAGETITPASTYLDNEDAGRKKERELAKRRGRPTTNVTGPQGLLSDAPIKKKKLLA